jgi:hypothetical protein
MSLFAYISKNSLVNCPILPYSNYYLQPIQEPTHEDATNFINRTNRGLSLKFSQHQKFHIS